MKAKKSGTERRIAIVLILTLVGGLISLSAMPSSFAGGSCEVNLGDCAGDCTVNLGICHPDGTCLVNTDVCGTTPTPKP